MELFSEIYGCYYSVVARILEMAYGKGIDIAEIDRIVHENAFSESGFHLLPRLLGGEWNLLREENGQFFSKLKHKKTDMPLTGLQKSWLKSLISDRRIKLFFDEARLVEITDWLCDIEPLFCVNDFYTSDVSYNGDDYTDEDYVRNFRIVLSAIEQKKILMVQYESGKGTRKSLNFLPQNLIYSAKDDKFRVVGQHLTKNRTKQILLNISRIKTVDYSQKTFSHYLSENYNTETVNKRTVQLAISSERNALERCMLQFASYDKQTVFDEKTNRYICDISYDTLEETEVLIRILSFGPVVEVLAPEQFKEQIRKRIRMQMEIIDMY